MKVQLSKKGFAKLKVLNRLFLVTFNDLKDYFKFLHWNVFKFLKIDLFITAPKRFGLVTC